jgi:hypothetical protein
MYSPRKLQCQQGRKVSPTYYWQRNWGQESWRKGMVDAQPWANMLTCMKGLK